MWRGALSALAEVGWHAFAPDLAGFGDSEPDPPGTWERHVEAIDRFAASWASSAARSSCTIGAA